MVNKRNNNDGVLFNPFILIKDLNNKKKIIRIDKISRIYIDYDKDTKIVMEDGETFYSRNKVEELYELINNRYNSK